jgi:ribosomal protein L32
MMAIFRKNITECPKCGSHIQRRRSKNAKGHNFGREYQCCSRKGRCDYFEWTEPPPPAKPGESACPKCGAALEMGKSKRRVIQKGRKKIKNPNFGRPYMSCTNRDCDYFEWEPPVAAPVEVVISCPVCATTMIAGRPCPRCVAEARTAAGEDSAGKPSESAGNTPESGDATLPGTTPVENETPARRSERAPRGHKPEQLSLAAARAMFANRVL